MIQRLTLILSLIISSVFAMAQGESSYTLKLKALNGMTNAQVEAKFILMEQDSTVVDTIPTPVYRIWIGGGGDGVKRMEATWKVLKAVPGSEKILKVEAEGFETETMPVVFPSGKNRTVDMQDIKLWPVRSSVELDEVVVKHSRVKMVMKGDTIVFDAAKFQLAHGDMLSQMVKQMEGLSIENGVIYMNGRKVDDLLVNGESFFKGDTSVALNNLPAFTIRNIKFYEKDPDSAYLTGQTIGEEKDYVLDVTLKKEYVTGYLGNLEGGYGTKDRYIGRGFGLGFGQKFRLSAFANLNNLQNVQTATASSDGDWDSRGTGSYSGLADRQLAGIDYIWGASKDIKLKGEVSFQHNSQQNDQIISSTNFLDSGDTYSRENIYDHRREFRLSTYHNWQLTKPQFFMELRPELDYNHFNTDNLSLLALYDVLPLETKMGEAVDSLFSGSASSKWSEGLKYTRYSRMRTRPNSLDMRLTCSSRIKFSADATDYLSVGAFVKYSNGKTPGIQDYALEYPVPDTYDDRFVRLDRQKSRSLEWQGSAGYDWRSAPNSHDVVFSVNPSVSFNSKHNNAGSRYYPLGDVEWTGPWASIELNDQIQEEIDRRNSNWSTEQTDNTLMNVQLGLAKSVRLLQLRASAGINRRHSSMDFNRPDFYQRVSRRDWLPVFTMNVSHTRRTDATNLYVYFSARYEESVPGLSYLVDKTNTLDPLNIYLSNPDLKRPSTINMNGNANFYHQGLKMGGNVYGGWTFYRNRTEYSRLYDAVTGSTTWTPISVNGCNSGYAGISTHTNIYKGLTGNIGYNLSGVRNVEVLTDMTFSGRNTVNYLTHNPNLGLTWNQTDLDIWTSCGYELGKSHSSRPGYGDYSLESFSIWNSIEYKCPWKMKLISEFNFRTYKGNDNNAMNSDDYFWTIRVSQPFANDKWSVTLTFADILNSRKTLMTNVSAKAATTTLRQQLPRYIMATISYRFHYNPSK